MRFLKKINNDLIALGIGAIVIMTCSVLLYAEITKKIEAGGTKQIGTITFKREVAQRKYASQVIWEDLEQSTPVYNFDTVRTAENSEARINLNGTYINLDENSLILLSLTKEGINIDFAHGSISANRGDTREGEPGKINIKSSDAVVSLEKGDVKLSKTENKELDVTVTDGKADIKTETEKKTIEKDEKAVVSKDSATQVIRLKLKLTSPVSNTTVFTAERTVPVNFVWEPAPGNTAVLFEIAKDAKFVKGVIAKKSAANSINENLTDGAYYWRIRAFNEAAKAPEFSDVWKVTVVKDEPPALISPQNGETFAYLLKPPIVGFRWVENKLASEYVLEISRDQSFKTIVQSVSTPLRDISIDTLEAGIYFWRINAKNAVQPSHMGTSPVRQIYVVKRAALQPPALISPPDTSRHSTAMFGKDKKFIFSWSADGQISRYEFMISSDKDFGNIIYRANNFENFYLFDKALQPGVYYWRVGAAGEGGQTAFSRSSSLSVVSVENIGLNDPLVVRKTGAGEEDKRADVRFSWIKSDFPGSYRFELSGDPGFLDIKDARTLADTQVTVPGLGAGVYFWRVKLVDNDRNQIAGSEARPLYMSTEGTIVAGVGEIERIKAAKANEEQEKAERIKSESEALKQAELAKKAEEAAKKEQEELARARQRDLEKKKQEELARIKREEAERKKLELLANKKLQEQDRIREQQKRGLKEKFPGRRVKWRTNIASAVVSQPVVYSNIILTTTKSGFLVGLSLTGRQLWRVNLGSMARSTPAADSHATYMVTVKGLLMAIDITKGTVKWTKSIDGPLLFGAAPLIEDDRIFIATSYGVVQALSTDGKEVWRKELEEGIFSPIASAKGLLYIGTDRSMIYAIDKRDGSIKWTFKTDSRIFSSAPRVYRGMLYTGCYSGTFYALNAENGRLVWRFASNKPLVSSPAFLNDMVYFGSEDGMFYALNVNTGKKDWEFDTKGSIVAGPNVAQNAVIIPSGNTIYSVDALSGELNWKEGFASGINTPVTVGGDSVFVGLDNGEVISMRPY